MVASCHHQFLDPVTLGTEDKYVWESKVLGDPVSHAVVEQLCHPVLESQHLSFTV